MSFPAIFRRLFENGGAGPKLRKDILPSHADTHAPGGSDPLNVSEIGGISAEAFAELQQQVAALAGSLGQGDPWDIFPLRVPIPVVGVTFGGSDGRRAIMPGETEAREGWILCDGGSDGKDGTVPDLRGRMILGASDEHEAGSTGGSETHSHSISGTVGSTTLSTSQMPSHSHSYSTVNAPGSTWGQGATQLSRSDRTTGTTGGSSSHTHSLSGSARSTDSLPPFFSLVYVIRCA